MRSTRRDWPARQQLAWFVRFARKKPLGAIGAITLAVMVLVAIFANVIAPYSPYATDAIHSFQGPSLTHFFGTDQLGRDTFSRVVFGARLSVLISVSVTLAGSAIGGLIGITGAVFGGKVDTSIQRVVDVMIAFPTLILLLALVSALGPSVITVIVALTVGITPRMSRIVRSAALSVNASGYVDASVALGAKRSRIILRHVAPNCMAPWIIVAATLFGQVIVSEASLAFLGLGVPPPIPSWGRELSVAQGLFMRTPWLAIFPGVAISVVVFSANLLGDALRDVLDPRMRGTGTN